MTPDLQAGHAPSEPPPFPTTPSADGMFKLFGLIELPIALATADTTIVWCSDAFADLASQNAGDLIGRRVADALGTERADRVTAVLADVAASDRTLGRAVIGATDWAGTVRKLAISATLTTWGGLPHLAVAVENKTNDRRTIYSQDVSLGPVSAAAAHALAALPTRSTFESLFDAALRRADRNGVPIGVMACSLDGYDEVAQRLGRDASETLIAATAARLAHALRGEDLLFHEGDCRFIVVADAVASDEVAHQVARRLRAAVSEPIILDNIEVRVGLSIGYSLGLGCERARDFIVGAERALHAAIERGHNLNVSVTALDAVTHSVQAEAIDWNELAR